MRSCFCFASSIVVSSLALALPRVASGQDAAPEPPPAWGLHSGDTVGEHNTLIYGELGWPDVSLGFQRGVGPDVDVGVRTSFSYGIDYVVPKQRANNAANIAPGFGVSVPLRFTLHRSARVSVLIHADPGIKFDGFDPKPFVGPELPLGVDLGVHVTARCTLTLGADLPLSIRLTPDVTAFIPLLVGLTFESRFTDRFGMSFNLRTGIVHGINTTGSDTDLGLIGQVGFFGRT